MFFFCLGCVFLIELYNQFILNMSIESVLKYILYFTLKYIFVEWYERERLNKIKKDREKCQINNFCDRLTDQ